jgi:hypothetical protein
MKIPYKFKRTVNNIVTVQKVYEQLSMQAHLKLVHYIQSSYSFITRVRIRISMQTIIQLSLISYLKIVL